VAKFKHETLNFGSSTGVVSQSATTTFSTHTAPNLPSDTIARMIFSVQFNVVIDPTGNPPPIEWWGNSRVVFAAAWNPGGGSTLPSSENDQSLKYRWVLYPTPWYSQPSNALYGVSFQPRADNLLWTTRHKGNGTNMPKVAFGCYFHDSNLAITNPGGIYSLTSSWMFYAKGIWESDT